MTTATQSPAMTTHSALSATSDYYGAGPGIKVVRAALRAVQAVSHRLSVRAAYRLFGTPLPLKWAQRNTAPAHDWQAREWPFEQATITSYSCGGDIRRTVLLVHGWGGFAGQMLPLASTLIKRGMNPVLLEMPAHGRSRGMRSNLPQFARAIDYLTRRIQQQGGTVTAVVAHSLGANAAAFAASRNLPIGKLVLVAPPASPLQFTRLFAHVFALSERTRAGMQQRIETTEAILMPDLEPHAVGPRINVPTLIVHDRGDRINSFADGVAYSEHIARARLVATDGLGHRRVLADATVLEEITAYLTDDAESMTNAAAARAAA